MADAWKLEAIHQQFDIFTSLSQQFQNILLNDFQKLSNTVSDIIKKHSRLVGRERSLREISAEIIKHSGNEDTIKFTFSVIIIKQEENNGLFKTPLFIVMSGNQLIFIDMRCSIYRTWADFLKQNDLPKCEFCFPINGHYNVQGNLKVDFAKSPKALCSRSMWSTLRQAVVGIASAGLIVASFFFKIPPKVYTYAEDLIPLANNFIPGLSDILLPVMELSRLVVRYRCGNIGLDDLVMYSFSILCPLYNKFHKEIWKMLNSVKEILKSTYDYICKMFAEFYWSSSQSSQHQMILSVLAADAEIRNVEQECQIGVVEPQMAYFGEPQMAYLGEPQMAYLGEPQMAECTKGSIDVERNDMNVRKNIENGGVEQIFDNCKDECAFQTGITGRDNKELTPITEELLAMTKYIANVQRKDLQGKDLRNIKDIFDALSSILIDEYRKQNQIQTYNKAVRAAKAATGHNVDIEAFNKSFGVVGRTEDHFWNEALQSLKQPRIYILVKETIKQLKRQQKPYMVPVWEDEENGKGLYTINGVKEGEILSSRMILDTLKDSKRSIDLDEDNIKITENHEEITILSKKHTIIVYQELTENNTCEGLLFLMGNGR